MPIFIIHLDITYESNNINNCIYILKEIMCLVQLKFIIYRIYQLL